MLQAKQKDQKPPKTQKQKQKTPQRNRPNTADEKDWLFSDWGKKCLKEEQLIRKALNL